MLKSIFFLLIITLNLNAFAQKPKVWHAKATYYSKKFDGRKTYSGERFNSNKFTAAHRNFPLQTLVKVINPKNSKYVIVRINDRFFRKNYIDLTYIAAKNLDIIRSGIANVNLQILDSTYMEEYLSQSKTTDLIDTNNYTVSKLPETDSSLHYYIRVASFKFKKNAEVYLSKELPKNFKAIVSIRKTTFKKKPLYKVIVGPYATKTEAEEVIKKTKKKFKDATIIQ